MEKLYSLKEVAYASGKGLAAIRQACARQQLLTTKLGEQHFVSECDLMTYLLEYDPIRAEVWRQRTEGK
jgi:hypothetical protein